MTPAPATELLPGGGRRWSVVTEGHRLTLELSPVACTDDMSGAAYPMTARLTVDGKELRGCGRPGCPGSIVPRHLHAAAGFLKRGSDTQAREPAGHLHPDMRWSHVRAIGRVDVARVGRGVEQ